MIPRILLAAAAALALALPAGAQTVHGAFVEPASGVPVPAARVTLRSADGRVVASTLTDAQGRFSLRAPGAGEYRLRGERIGYAASESPPLQLREGAPVEHRLAATGGRVMLEAVTVSARTRCTPRPGASQETAVVWEEIRKALDGVVSTVAEREAYYTVELYERDVEVPSGEVRNEQRRERSGVAEKPFVPVDPAHLAEAGYVERDGDALLYAAPDADVLLSETFLDGHCFQLRTAGAPERGLIGLAFEPVRDRRVPDVQGVLWVDRASAELRLLEFEYTRPPLRGPRGVPGGRLEFLRLPDGRWITSSWQIRMPVEGLQEGHTLVARPRQVVAIREVGGVARPGTAPRLAAAAPPPAQTLLVPDTTDAPPALPAPVAPSAIPAPSRVPSARASDRRRLIGRDEVERSAASTAFELVQTLRPQWLRARGNDAIRAETVQIRGGGTAVLIDESPIVVYLDGARMGRLDALRGIHRADVDRVEFYDAAEAQQRFGVGHPQGAIQVITRRG